MQPWNSGPGCCFFLSYKSRVIWIRSGKFNKVKTMRAWNFGPVHLCEKLPVLVLADNKLRVFKYQEKAWNVFPQLQRATIWNSGQVNTCCFMAAPRLPLPNSFNTKLVPDNKILSVPSRCISQYVHLQCNMYCIYWNEIVVIVVVKDLKCNKTANSRKNSKDR